MMMYACWQSDIVEADEYGNPLFELTLFNFFTVQLMKAMAEIEDIE